MTIPNDQFDPGHDTPSNESPSTNEITADFRRDLAFPTLSEEMVQRLEGYGREEIVPQGVILYTHGDRNTDMFVVLDGGVDVLLPSLNGALKVFARHRRHDFSGEFSLLNSQRAVTEARTTVESRLLRISRSELRLLMRVEGDIANIIVSAAIWRRIGINARSIKRRRAPRLGGECGAHTPTTILRSQLLPPQDRRDSQRRGTC